MLKNIHLRSLPALLALAGFAATAHAGTGILANNGAFKPQIALSESLTEKLVRFYTVELDPNNPGDSFDDLNGNGKRDTGEDFFDDNENGKYDAPRFIRVYTYGKQPSQKVTARIVANLARIGEPDPETGIRTSFDFSTINEETPVSITVGDYTFSSTLGEEVSRGFFTTNATVNGVEYLAGDRRPLGTSALYKFGFEYPKLNSDGSEATDSEGNTILLFKQTGSLSIAWSATAKTVTFTLEERTQGPDIPFDDAATEARYSFAADRLAGQSTRLVKPFANQRIPVSVSFGDASGTRAAYAKGITKARANRFLSNEVDGAGLIRSVNFIAAPDNEAPKLTVNTPAAADPELFGVDFLGSVADRPAPTFSDLFDGVEGDPGLESFVPTLGLLINGRGLPAMEEGGVETPFPIDYTDSFGNLIDSGDPENPPTTPLVGLNGIGFFGGFVELVETANTLTFTATDAEGNTTVVTKKVSAKALEEYLSPNPAL